MAVPGRRNGMNDDDEENNNNDNALFEEEGLLHDHDRDLDDADTPPHLRDLSVAAQLGDLPALILALGPLLSPFLSSFFISSIFYSFIYFFFLFFFWVFSECILSCLC